MVRVLWRLTHERIAGRENTVEEGSQRFATTGTEALLPPAVQLSLQKESLQVGLGVPDRQGRAASLRRTLSISLRTTATKTNPSAGNWSRGLRRSQERRTIPEHVEGVFSERSHIRGKHP